MTEQQRVQLGRIRASNLHLLGIIDEVLDFSRLDAGRITVARRAGRLGTPIDQALELVQMQARAKGVALADSVSGFAADVPYLGDEDRVRQILVILLSNAVKFTPSGGRITISAGTTEQPPSDTQLPGPGPWVYVRVEDTGPGIPAERIAAIFELFEQADMSMTRQHGGTGLGLTIAQRLARLMGGDIVVRSEQGLGSTFFLWLPAAAEEAVKATLSSTQHMDSPGPKLLQEIHDAMLVELERVLHAYVARLRSDPATPSAHALSEAELEDHLATFLSDLAQTFSALDLAAGTDVEALRDSRGHSANRGGAARETAASAGLAGGGDPARVRNPQRRGLCCNSAPGRWQAPRGDGRSTGRGGSPDYSRRRCKPGSLRAGSRIVGRRCLVS